jgi:hypothetical protein
MSLTSTKVFTLYFIAFNAFSLTRLYLKNKVIRTVLGTPAMTTTMSMSNQVQRMDSFRLLLNDISHQLTEQNLQSLIHIFNVPGGVRKQINDGLALFAYMITQDYISREKVGNLRNLIRKIRPHRKDLVRLVDNYIKKEFQTDNVRSVIGDFSESWPGVILESPVTVDEETAVCKIDCGYSNCVCRRVPSCYVPTIVLLVIAIIATAVCWYADVPKISKSIKSNSDLKRAGVYILIAEILALLLVICLRIRRNLVSCLACHKSSYTVLANPDDQGPSRQITSASDVRLQRVASAPRSYKTSASESAIFSDASGDPSSLSTFGTFQPMDEFPKA